MYLLHLQPVPSTQTQDKDIVWSHIAIVVQQQLFMQ